jgi:hypothetical protein
VSVTASCLLYRQRLLEERLGTRVPALPIVDGSEIVQHRGDPRVRFAKGGFVYGQRLQQQRFSARVFAPAFIHITPELVFTSPGIRTYFRKPFELSEFMRLGTVWKEVVASRGV